MSNINDIPNSWQETNLGEVCKPKGGKRLPKGETLISERTNHPYIRITDFEGNSINKNNLQYVPDETFKKISRYIVNEGDVIISIVGTIGLVALIDDELDNASLTENCVKLTKLESIHNVFMYYYLISKYGQYEIDINTVGAVQKKLPIYGVENINLFLPPLSEQKAIANILTAFDDKIENLQAQNNTLEQTAQTIFKEWFFTKNKSSYEVSLGDLIEIRGGYSYKGSELGMGESYLLGMGCVSNNHRFLHKGARLYSNNVPDSFLVKPGEIVLATRQQSENLPILGYPAVIPQDYEGKKVIVGTNLYMVNNTSSLNNETLFLLLKSQKYRNHILNNSKGTTVKMITKDSVESFNLNMPNEEVISNFTSIINPITDKIKNNNSQIQTLKQTRDTLLPKLMNGQLRVNEFKS